MIPLKTPFHIRKMLKMSDDDKVNHPSHYKSGGLEVIDIIEAKLSPDQLKGYYLGNIMKYVFRHEYKDGITDLKKALWYLDRLISNVSKET
jgi:hypothetical protein